MIITLSGAQGVGKTTLLNAMKNDPFFAGFKFVDEIVRTLMKGKIKINEEGDDETQYAVMDAHRKNSVYYKNAVLDRCALDGLVYTIYLHRRGRVTDETLKYAKDMFTKCVRKYDKMFVIAPEFDIQDDGVRSMSQEFQAETNKIFLDLAKQSGAIQLSGTVQERLDQIKKHCTEI